MAFEKESPFVAEHLGLEKQDFRDLGPDDVQVNTFSVSTFSRYWP
jgi:hypothetical protein